VGEDAKHTLQDFFPGNDGAPVTAVQYQYHKSLIASAQLEVLEEFLPLTDSSAQHPTDSIAQPLGAALRAQSSCRRCGVDSSSRVRTRSFPRAAPVRTPRGYSSCVDQRRRVCCPCQGQPRCDAAVHAARALTGRQRTGSRFPCSSFRSLLIL
jgi:hypothetical protein